MINFEIRLRDWEAFRPNLPFKILWSATNPDHIPVTFCILQHTKPQLITSVWVGHIVGSYPDNVKVPRPHHHGHILFLSKRSHYNP